MDKDKDNENEFTHEGVEYVAVEMQLIGAYVCGQCAFDAAGCSPESAPPCSTWSRKDRREIIWKIKTETTGQTQ